MQTWQESTSVRPRSSWMLAPLGGLLASAAVVWSEGSPVWREMPPRYRASGSLRCGKLPASDAVLTFHPLSASLPVHPQAIVQPDGRFEVRTPYFGTGAPAGEYAVTVSLRPYVADGEHWYPGPSPVPNDYADPARTPLRARIEPRINRLAMWSVPCFEVNE